MGLSLIGAAGMEGGLGLFKLNHYIIDWVTPPVCRHLSQRNGVDTGAKARGTLGMMHWAQGVCLGAGRWFMTPPSPFRLCATKRL